MANLVVVSNSFFIKLDFGVYAEEPYNFDSPFLIGKGEMDEVSPYEEGVVIVTNGHNSRKLYITHLTDPGMATIKDPWLTVDSIGGTTVDSQLSIINAIYDL